MFKKDKKKNDNSLLLMSMESSVTYATWNPSDKSSSANCILSNGNLTAACGGADAFGNRNVRATQGKSSGKWYWEVRLDSGSGNFIAIANSIAGLDAQIGADANSWGYYSDSGNKWNSGGSAYGASYVAGNILQVALDMDNGKVWFGKSGTWQASGDPAAGTNAAFTGITGTIYPMHGNGGTVLTTVTANFGATAFTYSVPSGYNLGVYI